MKIRENLGYRIKRFFEGESGIVEKVELFDIENSPNKPATDYYKQYPTMVTVRTPLGDLVKIQSPLTTEYLPDNIGLFSASVYKIYKPGDRFP